MRIKPGDRKNKRRVAVTQYVIKWNARFNELKLFKERFNHCNVPQNWPENKSLGRWVIRQRAYREYLSPDQVTRLNSLGFIWDIPDYYWEVNYEILKKFREKHGHTMVPKGSGPYAQLAEWVGNQRRNYKNNCQSLTEERIQKLNSIQFYWGVNNTPWEKRFAELKEYKSKFGTCQIPMRWKGNPQLAAWVAIQRREYKHNRLSAIRFQLLNEIGFLWSNKSRQYSKLKSI